jgi:hypothetical protein
MIVPIVGLKYYDFKPIKIDDEVLLVKEKDNLYDDNAVAVFNMSGEKIGYIGSRSSRNHKVNSKMNKNDCIGKVWCITRNQVLIELDFTPEHLHKVKIVSKG